MLDRLVTVDGIVKAVGQTLKGKKGGEISIKAVEQHKDGDVTVRLTLANLPAEEVRPGLALPPGLVIVRESAPQQRAKADMPKLLDEHGQAYDLRAVVLQKMENIQGTDTEVLTLTYRRQEGQGEAARLVVDGRRWFNFEVPFELKNVPLR